ncbi:MAG TPA: DNA alkylation repair protein [Cyclobacteriaceae bacterium]|nr:DNA alkylation repair protein [Cyclobacteriaceae bacterium]
MKSNPYHAEILHLIKKHAGKPTQHTFSDKYLGNTHFRYPIDVPTLRRIGKDWMRAHPELNAHEIAQLLTSLITSSSATEKTMAGIILDYTTIPQRKFDPALFDAWLDHLVGWAEIDALCTGAYTLTEISAAWPRWKKLLRDFSKSNNISKRRASIVLLVAPLRRCEDPAMIKLALENIDRLKAEKDILITKAISWVLRSAIPAQTEVIKKYLNLNQASLPKIAVRETLTKLRTGKKTKSKPAKQKKS